MSIHQNQSREESELPNRVVGIVHRLRSFLPDHADPHMRSTQHFDVVGSIADCESHDFVVSFANQTRQLRFLVLASATRDDGLAGLRHHEELSHQRYSGDKKYGLTTGESEEVDEELIDHESHRLG